MGLLDDAIREHLDLKRRRGADPAEIERAEREALGPVRRNREPAPDDTGELSDAGYPAAAVGSALDEPDGGIAADLVDEGDDDFPGEDELAAYDGEDPRADEPFGDFADDAPETRVMRTTDIPAPTQRTAEFDVEDAFADEDDDEVPGTEPADEDDDVLEETPEFLQDTPDHDRLWFEQRPPRDFDFDG